MAKDLGDCLSIMRRVIGQNDQDDPNATDALLIQYISDFYDLILPQDVKTYDQWEFLEFDTIADQSVYPLGVAPLPTAEYVNYKPPVFVDDQQINWWQDPDLFYEKWPLDTSNLGTGRPTDVLFFGNQFVFRTVPDDAYTIRIVAYKQNGALADETDELAQDYIWRYVAYGAAIDWLTDYGQIVDNQHVLAAYERYRDIVLRRTAVQLNTQKPYLAW